MENQELAEDESQQLPEGYDTTESVQPTAEQPLSVEDVLQFVTDIPFPAPQEQQAVQVEADGTTPATETTETTADNDTIVVAEQTEQTEQIEQTEQTEQTEQSTTTEGGAETVDGAPTPTTARKRKSRWGVLKSEEGKEGEANDPNAKPKRKSRFQLGPPETNNNNNGVNLANSALAPLDGRVLLQQEMITVQTRLRELQAFALNPATFSAKGFDGPSPDPIYDSNGKRVNTRESRVRDFIKKEQQELVARAIELQGKITGVPVLPTTIRTRKEIRIPIPFETYPDYNFKGVLIGARGLNQKRLEKETNCMIAVRGKGMRKKLEGVDSPEDNMEVHVLVAAYDQADLDKGVARVKELLVPVSLEERQKQLRELDLLNGTVRPEQLCHGCGESGHKLYNCPKRFENRSWKPANIVCTICGDVTHAYIDCPSNRPGVTHSFAQRLNSEYDSFMAELTGEKAPEKKDEAGGPKPPGAPGVPGIPGQAPPGGAAGARPPFPHPMMGPRMGPANPMMARFNAFNPLGIPRPNMPPLNGAFNPLIQGNPFLGKFGPPRPDLRPGMTPGLPPPVQFRPGNPPPHAMPGQPLLGFPQDQSQGSAGQPGFPQAQQTTPTGQTPNGQAFPPGLGNFPGQTQPSYPPHGNYPGQPFPNQASQGQYPPATQTAQQAYPPNQQAQASYPPTNTAAQGQYPPVNQAQGQYPPATQTAQGQYPPVTQTAQGQYPPAQYPPATQGQYPPPTQGQYPPVNQAQGYPPTGTYPGQPLLQPRVDPNIPPWLIGQPAPQYPPASSQAPWVSSSPSVPPNVPYYTNPYVNLPQTNPAAPF